MEFLGSVKRNGVEDRGFGCILGAFIGDAIGSFREFSDEIATQEEMDQCMLMPGGGPFMVGPGQITDDSEMAMCIL